MKNRVRLPPNVVAKKLWSYFKEDKNMIWLGNGNIKMEEGEPSLRSCWKCNPAHEHLKTVNMLHTCFECGRYWVYDRFVDSFVTDEKFDNFFRYNGLKEGESTSKIDKGYRLRRIRNEQLPR